jgi:hypothetical protein
MMRTMLGRLAAWRLNETSRARRIGMLFMAGDLMKKGGTNLDGASLP